MKKTICCIFVLMLLVSYPIVFGSGEDIKPDTTEYIFEGF